MKPSEVRMGDVEAIENLRARRSNGPAGPSSPTPPPTAVAFNRLELREILNVYGRLVAAGDTRDYAIDMLKERAVFSLFRHMGEMPLYRIEKNPALRSRQGMYSVVAATGLILKRGNELDRVLGVLDRKVRLVAG
ncbi:DUF2794 domain-containing protein [Terrihabitans sp. B22-R8]|uniref:DUF2794 domain-containing protein n=1 Tax=Terrihabitans sp. B22-R8 TaxID=3425128 RepID=UPI00403CEA6F